MPSPEEKLLISIYSKEVFEGNFIRQEVPRCCGKEIDLYSTDVDFTDINIGEKKYTLLEPICPLCGKRVRATFHIIN